MVFAGLLWGAAPMVAQCSFTASDLNPCADESITLTVDNPNGSSTYEWDLDGDGNIDQNGAQISYTFPLEFTDITYEITLFQDGDSCVSQAITVLASPDPALGVPPGIISLDGNSIQACNGDNSIDLEIFNASATYAENVGYTINWGDGTPTETHDNTTFSNATTISHTYVGLGYYTIFLTATHQNGCSYTTSYTFYNGGNPSVGIVIPGNTVGLCAPATLEFPITNTDNNPPGTVYTVLITGDTVATFTQDDLPPTFTYTFEEGSCDSETSTGNYMHAYDVQIIASNPCNSSTATIEPIEVSEPPQAEFFIVPPPGNCPGEVFEFQNDSEVTEVISGNPSSCVDVLNPTWTISGTPGTDWEIVSGSLFGSNNLQITFLEPGVYTIEMVVISFACGEFAFSQTVTISDPPTVDADALLVDIGNGCVPVTVPFGTNSTGVLNYNWNINPPTGWQFDAGTDSTSANPSITFTEGGAYDISLLAGNDCQEISWDTTIILNGPPNLLLAPLPDVCYETTLSFSGNNLEYDENGLPIDSYSWSFPGGSTTSDTVAFPSGILYDQPGTYAVTLEATNGCGSNSVTDSFEVQVPENLALPNDFELCNNEETVSLQAQPNGGQWSGTGVQANGNFHPEVAGAGTFQLMYSYGVGACLVEEALTVTVHPIPDVDAGPDQTVCLNDPALVLNASPSGGQWLSPGGIASGGVFAPQTAGVGDFGLFYVYEDANGCENIDSLEIGVLDLPELMVPDSSYCFAPGLVTLPAPTPTGGYFDGPGAIGNQLFDPMQVNNPGNHSLQYIYTDNNGCTNTTNLNIQLDAPPLVQAGPDQSLCMENGTITLTDFSPQGGVWEGSGILDPQAGIFEPAIAGGGYHLLTYEYGEGNCLVIDSISVEVIHLQGTSAGPQAEVCLNQDPLLITGGTPLGGTWSGPGIINGNTGVFDPSTLSPGTYEIIYTILDDDSGCTASDQKPITVHELPVAAFELPDIDCIQNGISPTNQSTGATSYQWDFGDGIVAQDAWPNHQFSTVGTFEILLTAINDAGCETTAIDEIFITAAPEAEFELDNPAGCGPLEVGFDDLSDGFDASYLWSFGNGQTSASASPNPITYPAGFNDTTYTIQLQVSNLCGTDIWEKTVEVYPDPLANFGILADTGCAPMQVQFNNISLGSPANYYWNFGNGNFSTDSLPAPQWYSTDTSMSNYTIQLIVSNQCGIDTMNQVVTVEPESVTSFFNTSTPEGCSPLTVGFTNYSTFGTTVSWDFGDGNLSNQFNPNHTFVTPGEYIVTQYITNGCGDDSSSVMIEVLPPPQVGFDLPEITCTNQSIQLENTSGQLAGFEWDFGNGTSSTLSHPSLLYSQPGTYTITLTGFDELYSCPGTISQDVTIHAPPIGQPTLDNSDGCTPLTVSFTGNTQNGDYFSWDFGDGNQSISPNPVHTFWESGTYDVELIVTNIQGCSDTSALDNLFAYPSPTVGFEFEKDQDCGLPVGVNFTNTSLERRCLFMDFWNG